MPLEVTKYKNCTWVSIHKVNDDTYTVTIEGFHMGMRSYTRVYTFDFSHPSSTVIGVYQLLHPHTYETDTEVLDQPINLSSSSVLANLFANCKSMVEIDLRDAVEGITKSYDNNMCFYVCEDLVSVNLGSFMDRSNHNTYESMFDGCLKLKYVDGVIDITQTEPKDYKNMFRYCPNLKRIYIRNGEGIHDIRGQGVILNDIVYERAWEIMGLTEEQVNNCVIYVSDYDPENDLIEEEANDAFDGAYKNAHRNTYRTDTSVQDAPLDVRGYAGLFGAFAQCSSLQSVDVNSDVLLISGYAARNDGAFYYCRSLKTVNLRNALSSSQASFITCGYHNQYNRMFYGCEDLETIIGTIDFTHTHVNDAKDMFKGCTSLQSVTLKNGTGKYDLYARDVLYEDVVYDYGYQILGLTAYQMETVVTVV